VNVGIGIIKSNMKRGARKHCYDTRTGRKNMTDINELLEAYKKRYTKKKEMHSESKEVTTIIPKGK